MVKEEVKVEALKSRDGMRAEGQTEEEDLDLDTAGSPRILCLARSADDLSHHAPPRPPHLPFLLPLLAFPFLSCPALRQIGTLEYGETRPGGTSTAASANPEQGSALSANSRLSRSFTGPQPGTRGGTPTSEEEHYTQIPWEATVVCSILLPQPTASIIEVGMMRMGTLSAMRS